MITLVQLYFLGLLSSSRESWELCVIPLFLQLEGVYLAILSLVESIFLFPILTSCAGFITYAQINYMLVQMQMILYF